MINLRPYQTEAVQGVFKSWHAGNNNVCTVLPTGAGKTVVATNIINQWQGFKLACAHRQELVGQISLAFAAVGVPHRLCAPDGVIRDIQKIHRLKFGRSFVDMQAPTMVAGVDTIIARMAKGDRMLASFLSQVVVWFIDECHHILLDNKWGKVTQFCPTARGLGVTATPLRADGKGLGAHVEGVFHDMIVGPTMRDLIDMGFLCDYAPPICPPSDMKVDQIKIGANGDYTAQGLKKAAQESHIVGDIVKHYQRYAGGKLGITFATDVQTAGEVAAAYREAGVPAEAVSAKTNDLMRHQIIERFRNRELLQLVNVDLFGEGFDLPALEVVSMARPTMSYGLYVQQFGRALRIMEGKDKAIIIDHVNNVRQHRLPDYGKSWTLDRRTKRGKKQPSTEIEVTTCEKCFKAYEKLGKQCPYCGHVKEPAQRSTPEFVDGDLIELDPATLQQLREDVAKVDRSPEQIEQGLLAGGAAPVVAASAAKNQRLRSEAQDELRAVIATWAGIWHAKGEDDSAIWRRFWQYFGMDVMSAQALGKSEAIELTNKVNTILQKERE